MEPPRRALILIDAIHDSIKVVDPQSPSFKQTPPDLARSQVDLSLLREDQQKKREMDQLQLSDLMLWLSDLERACWSNGSESESLRKLKILQKSLTHHDFRLLFAQRLLHVDGSQRSTFGSLFLHWISEMLHSFQPTDNASVQRELLITSLRVLRNACVECQGVQRFFICHHQQIILQLLSLLDLLSSNLFQFQEALFRAVAEFLCNILNHYSADHSCLFVAERIIDHSEVLQ